MKGPGRSRLVFTIYEWPGHQPDAIVVKAWSVEGQLLDARPMPFQTVEAARAYLADLGLVETDYRLDDDPAIVASYYRAK